MREKGSKRTMQTFEEIVDNGLTSREEVEMEHSAREAAFRYMLAVFMGHVNTALTAPDVYLNPGKTDGTSKFRHYGK
jgi:hypothetical protein